MTIVTRRTGRAVPPRTIEHNLAAMLTSRGFTAADVDTWTAPFPSLGAVVAAMHLQELAQMP